MFPANKKIRVLVVDDSVLARTMISNGLSASPRIEIAGTAINAKDARAKVDQLRPDVMTLDVEMPGFDKKDISLKFESGYITISAKKEQGAENSRYIRRERAVSCSRSYYMGDVDETQIKAKYENGVLVVTVPKDKPEQTKHAIAIE